jgi:hypothetical protein
MAPLTAGGEQGLKGGRGEPMIVTRFQSRRNAVRRGDQEPEVVCVQDQARINQSLEAVDEPG